ncbi:MAG: DUF3775 domain-containing protein [Sphingomonadaceae bacterium]
MELVTPLDTLCRIIIRAREYEAQVPAFDPKADPDNVDDDESPDDDAETLSVLEDELNTGVEEELRGILDDLAEDQLAETLALNWVGVGTYDPPEWEDAISEANDSVRDGTDHVIDELMETPLLAANLESGLAAFDLSCEGIGTIE